MPEIPSTTHPGEGVEVTPGEVEVPPPLSPLISTHVCCPPSVLRVFLSRQSINVTQPPFFTTPPPPWGPWLAEAIEGDPEQPVPLGDPHRADALNPSQGRGAARLGPHSQFPHPHEPLLPANDHHASLKNRWGVSLVCLSIQPPCLAPESRNLTPRGFLGAPIPEFAARGTWSPTPKKRCPAPRKLSEGPVQSCHVFPPANAPLRSFQGVVRKLSGIGKLPTEFV